MFKIEYYSKIDNTIPMNDFLDSLNDKMKTKVLRDMMLLREFGNDIREPQSKKLKSGIYELRSKQGSDISRAFYFFIVNKTIVFTNGYIKKARKMSNKDFEFAVKYKEDYLKRMGGK